MSIENPDSATEALDTLTDEQEAAEQQREEYATTKARLEQKRSQRRRMVEVLDEPVEFRPVGVGVARRAMRLRSRAMDGSADAEEALIDLVFETLADHAVDDEMDEEFWEGFSMSTVQSAFEELVMAELDIEDQEAIEDFREV
ncbi:hypothetical protein Z052_02055 [Halorubrum sp. C191]|uniref:hypothetical protein n=1 Tax=Halorubrum sp. C191 TaxID=1383842 RepID=UPI000C073AEB|nr:hypothetical protein [Halorubrum sp. C191]PHQ43946.1 hypothetical protein Z052_02055 [Halorubrum sp. C191]